MKFLTELHVVCAQQVYCDAASVPAVRAALLDAFAHHVCDSAAHGKLHILLLAQSQLDECASGGALLTTAALWLWPLHKRPAHLLWRLCLQRPHSHFSYVVPHHSGV